MSAEILAEQGSWRILAPAERRLIDAHLALVRAEPGAPFEYDDAADLITGYRAATSALHRCLGATGFMIGFALDWRPYGDGVGEPESIDGHDQVVHVFGRRPGEALSPVRAMARPQRERRFLLPDASLIDRLRRVLAGPPAPLSIEGPSGPQPAEGPSGARSAEGLTGPRPAEGPAGPRSAGSSPGAPTVEHLPAPPTEDRSATHCDGCASSVLTEQERWRADGVRVIRPRRVPIDPHVLVLPLRHVVSLRDLTADEVLSLVVRLKESLGQFRLASGSTGLTGFANDGIAARQETPHVHLHCYGRSVDEPVNPYARLAALLPKPQRPV